MCQRQALNPAISSQSCLLGAVGKSSFARCRRLLRPGGCHVSSELGPRAQNPLLALVTPLLRRREVLFPIPGHHHASDDDDDLAACAAGS